MGHYFRSYAIVGLFLLFSFYTGTLFAQEEYTVDALTGKGELELTEDEPSLQPVVMEAFEAMAAAAKKDGFNLTIASGYRSFERQRDIWNYKYQNFTEEGLSPLEAIEKIILYSTIPGTSRHHWGTDIDVIDSLPDLPEDVLLEKHFENDGIFARLKEWMDTHANSFGFYLVYTDIPGRKGFNYEPWHYTYKAVSREMLQQYLSLDLLELLRAIDIEGSEYLTANLIKSYREHHLLDINPVLK